jgi:ketosteroid isomerase-like protein
MSPLLWAAFLMTRAVADHPAAAFVDGWHAALQGDRREAVLERMTTDVTVYESGEAENSRDEYAAHHLDADMSFARATAGTFEGNAVSSSGLETMVLRTVDGGWRIAHIHWSSRRVPPRMPPSPSPHGSAPAPPPEHLSVGRLASQLQTAGLKVERKGSVRQPFFAVPAKVLAIGADEIEVFEFARAQDAEKAAATVSADGGTIGTSAMHWMAPPHFHRRGRTILIHLGSTAEVQSAIEGMAGAAFAGRR